MQDKAGGPSG